MPPRTETLPGGIVRLTKLLAQLNAAPKLTLHNVKNLRVTFSAQTDHIGARHFVKEELPRIRWVNPNLNIEVQKVRKTPDEKWRPEMEVELANGTVQKVDMYNKFSTSITQELMDIAGGEEWKKYAFASRNAGVPVVPGADKQELLVQERAERQKDTPSPNTKLPTLQEYLKANPKEAKALAERKTVQKSSPTTSAKGQTSQKNTS